MTALAFLGITQKELDDAINQAPKGNYRLLNDPMWRVKPLSTTSVMVEFVNGRLLLLPNKSRAEAPNVKAFGQNSTVRTFTPLHLTLETTIRPEQIQDVRKVGTTGLLTNASALAQEIEEHRSAHDLTLEHLSLGAIKGQLLDADGQTVLLDIFQAFNVSKPETTLPLNTATADVGLLLEQTLRKMSSALRGDQATGAKVLCSSEFFDALVSHKSVKDAWQRYQDNVLARENSHGKFAWKGLGFEIYDSLSQGGEPAIKAGEAHGYLTGMQRGFTRYYAPANMLSQANTVAQPYYTSVHLLEHGRGVSLYTESNPLPLCMQPQTLMHFKVA